MGNRPGVGGVVFPSKPTGDAVFVEQVVHLVRGDRRTRRGSDDRRAGRGRGTGGLRGGIPGEAGLHPPEEVQIEPVYSGKRENCQPMFQKDIPRSVPCQCR